MPPVFPFSAVPAKKSAVPRSGLSSGKELKLGQFSRQSAAETGLKNAKSAVFSAVTSGFGRSRLKTARPLSLPLAQKAMSGLRGSLPQF
jgi:hypothetical protein